MWTVVIILSVLCVAYFSWARIDSKRRKAEAEKHRTKPTFRTEDDVNEYAKPMADEHQSKAKFEDTEWD